MRKLLKWIGIILGGLIGLIVLAAIGLYVSVNLRLSKIYTIRPETVAIPTDAPSVARGQHWASIYCTGCHGDDLGGTAFFEDPAVGSIPAPNLTAGKGGAGSEFTDADWVRALRHGVDPQGKPLLIMPSGDLYYLSDGDLGDIIAYVKSVPPVDKEWDKYKVTPMARILMALGAFGDVLGVEVIDHNGPRPAAPAAGVTVEYGDYLVRTFGCRTCHGRELAGGKSPDPQAPPAPNLTPGGALRAWAEADFITAVRTRLSEFMPWKDLRNMTDDELKAVWLYVQSQPARESTMP